MPFTLALREGLTSPNRPVRCYHVRMSPKSPDTLADQVALRTARTLDLVVSVFPEDERAKIQVRARELIAEEMSLRKLREAIIKIQ